MINGEASATTSHAEGATFDESGVMLIARKIPGARDFKLSSVTEGPLENTRIEELERVRKGLDTAVLRVGPKTRKALQQVGKGT